MLDPSSLIVGCGYLGMRLALLWRGRGLAVGATTRSDEKASRLRSAGIDPVRWDVLRPFGNLPRVDRVVYCVGMDRSTGASMREVYVDGLRHTLSALPDPGRLVYLSSTGVFGDHAGGWVDETTPPDPVDESGAVCRDAEQVVSAWSAERGVRAVVLRLAGIYGPGRLIGALALRRGDPIPAEPDDLLNLIHVDDAVGVVDVVFGHPNPSALYLVSDGQQVRKVEFYRAVAERIGAPEPRFDATQARRHRGNRRISSRKMVEELGVRLRFPDFRTGIDSILEPSVRPDEET